MIETKEKEINGCKYTCTQMTARRALRMQAKLLKLFGASLAQIFLPGEQTPLSGLAFSKDEVIKALQSLASELSEHVFDNLVVELLKDVRKDGIELTENVIDLEFAGDLYTLFEVVFFVLEVNFSSFFSRLGIGNILQPMPKEKQGSQDTKKD